MWLLPFAGLESVNNGFQSSWIFVLERRLKLRWPLLLEWMAWAVSISVTLTWAWLSPSVWALAAGPVAGGFVGAILSFVVLPQRPRLRWEPAAARDLLHFGKWVYLGTVTAFVAQQFHVLYLGKVALLGTIGIYQVAWNFVLHSTKPLTMLANKVMIPFFAEYGRKARELHSASVGRALDRFLPACLLVCVCSFVFSPALFGFFYPLAYVEGGRIGRLLSVVAWFMILQQVPRSALLSIGVSKGVFWLTLANAAFTIAGVTLGYRPFGITGLILGNALGNLAGCFTGAWEARRHGVRAGLPMVFYSLLFAGASIVGYVLMLVFESPAVNASERMASLWATAILFVPIVLVLYRRVRGVRPPPAEQGGSLA
jgi:O-antigen/teichoic acid export membrane protein